MRNLIPLDTIESELPTSRGVARREMWRSLAFHDDYAFLLHGAKPPIHRRTREIARVNLAASECWSVLSRAKRPGAWYRGFLYVFASVALAGDAGRAQAF